MDELERLRRANPVSTEDTDEAVDVGRHIFLDATERASWQAAGERASAQNANASSAPKKAWAGVLAAAAAVLAFVAFAATDRIQDEDIIEASVASPAAGGDSILVQSADRGFDRATDLLVVHFDFVDPADAHAAVAAREISAWFDLDPVVVAGSRSSESSETSHNYVAMMVAAWGDRWLDANTDRSVALRDSLSRWLDTLDAGGHVWVAEGGVSDFTAEVVREILRQRPSLNTPRLIHVLQQSEASETGTLAGELAFVGANTTYRQVDPGDALNGTANLSGSTEAFETAVLSGTQRDPWSMAFEQLPTDELNFADAVLLLEILGVGTDQVATTTDYASFFIGDQPDAALRGES